MKKQSYQRILAVLISLMICLYGGHGHRRRRTAANPRGFAGHSAGSDGIPRIRAISADSSQLRILTRQLVLPYG